MANMLTTGVSGLTAAQIALNTVSNNISNTNTDGYSRQLVTQTERVSQTNGRYTVGSGVDVVAVQRAYSSYLTSAVWTSNSALQRATTYDDLASTLNSNLSNSGDLAGALDDFYSAFSSVANVGDTASRQSLLASASSLTTVFNTLGQQLDSQQQQINQQISGTVDSINSTISNIADINQQILQLGGNAPNSLLDQRDALVNTLSGYVGVNTNVESNGTLSVYTTSGQALVSGSNDYPLSTTNDTYDTSRTVVTDQTGTDISSRLSGGSLGALLDYRTNVLDVAQNQLGQEAIALSSSVNAQQAKGLDLDGQLGSAILSSGTPTVLDASTNQGTASVSASISDVSSLTSSDYVLRYNGSAWSLTTTAGQSVPLTTNADGSLSADGMTFNVSGTAVAGDSYKIEPTRNAATDLSVVMTDPDGIAAAAALTTSADSANTGSASVSSITVDDASDANLLSDATVSFPTAGTYQVTDSAGNVLSSGSYTSGSTISANGWSLTVDGTPAAGDSFTVSANTNGLSDNSNALAMAALADTGVLDGGSTSVIDAFTNLTTTIGSVGSQADTNLTTQTTLYNQALSAQQAVSGVNLDEEAANLVKYQQAYQASAQIISTAQTIFSSLISAISS